MTMATIPRILATTALCLAAMGVSSCQQNALTIKAGQDYFTPELQQQIQSTGWQITNCSSDNDSDRVARKTFRLRRADVHGGEVRYHIYYHEKTNQIILFAKNEIEVIDYKNGIPMFASSNSFLDTAEFPHYVYNAEREAHLQDSKNHRVDAIAPFWLNAFIACSCKDFHEKEQKRHGESVYDGVFSRNNTPGSSQ